MKQLKNSLNAAFILKNAVYIMLIIVAVVLSLTVDIFFTVQNLVNILIAASPIYLLCMGMSLAMMTKGIDMSIGSIIYASASVAFFVFERGGSMALALAGMLVMGILLGLINGLLAGKIPVYPMLTTLATMYIFRGVGRMISGGATAIMPAQWGKIATLNIFGIPFPIVLALVAGLFLQFIMVWTKFGRFVLAVGDNERTAVEKGVNIFKIKVAVYTITGLCCALAGMIMTSQVMSAPSTLGSGKDFEVIIAAVLGGISLVGGKGNIFPGALIGSIIYAGISNALVLTKADPYSYTMVYAIVIFAFILVDTLSGKVYSKKEKEQELAAKN